MKYINIKYINMWYTYINMYEIHLNMYTYINTFRFKLENWQILGEFHSGTTEIQTENSNLCWAFWEKQAI